MVSIKNLVTIGGLLAGAAAFISLGGASGIGSRIGGAFGSFGNNLIEGFQGSLGGITGGAFKTGAGQIVSDLQLGGQVTNIPTVATQQANAIVNPEENNKIKGGLIFAQFLKDQGLSGSIDLQDRSFNNEFTRQPLGFVIGPNAIIKTGRVGLGDATISAQQAFSDRFGIPTFDTKGNLSTFGGLAAAQQR